MTRRNINGTAITSAHMNCRHEATKAARAKCRKEQGIARSFVNNMLIVNAKNDREAFHALHSAIDNGHALHPDDEKLAAVEAMHQYRANR